MNQPVRVGGVPEHFNLPWRLAVANDAFRKIGVDVRYSEYPAGTGELTRALRDDELDVALVLTEGAVADILKNDTNRLVKVYVDSPLVWGIHVAAASDIEDINAIRGKRVAISRYDSGSHLIAIVDAVQRGWPARDMSFVVVNDLDGARSALAGGEADVFLWERHMTQPLVDTGEFRRVGQREVPWPAFVVSVRRAFLDTGAETVRSMLELVAGTAANFKRRRNAAQEVADSYGIRVGDATDWLAGVRWGGSFRRPTTALKRVIAALRSQGTIDTRNPDIDKIWYQI